MRVVFDTNIYVSVLVVPGSQAEQAIVRVVDGTDRLVLSKPLLDELLGVLARKFSRRADELAHVAVFLNELADFVRPQRRLAILTDEADNRVLECAQVGLADAIITGDKALLALGKFEGISILTLREYLN